MRDYVERIIKHCRDMRPSEKLTTVSGHMLREVTGLKHETKNLIKQIEEVTIASAEGKPTPPSKIIEICQNVEIVGVMLERNKELLLLAENYSNEELDMDHHQMNIDELEEQDD